MGVLKTQLEAYKRQVQDLQLKSTDETKRADKAEFEAKRQQEKAAVLAVDKEVVQLLVFLFIINCYMSSVFVVTVSSPHYICGLCLFSFHWHTASVAVSVMVMRESCRVGLR